MNIDILTLFPAMFKGVFNESILKRAQEKRLVQINTVNIRDYTTQKHGKVDDYPYGGGAGMVLMPQPVYDAVESVKAKVPPSVVPRTILLTPQGQTHSQKIARELAQEKHIIFICGHYEGFDERIRKLADLELSIGDYVLTGGELAAMVVIDSVVRLVPGVLGNEQSASGDSFSHHLLEHPHYTRPQDFRGLKVPDVLLSGDHGRIATWRHKESLRRTWLRRPDLLAEYPLNEEEKKWMKEFQKYDGLSQED